MRAHLVQQYIQDIFSDRNRTVCLSPQGKITGDQFHRAVMTHYYRFQTSHCHQWIIYNNDAFQFLVLFIAAVLAERSILIPGDDPEISLPRIKETISGEVQIAFFIEHAEDINVDESELVNLSIDPGRTVFFTTSGSTGQPKLITKTLQQLVEEVSVLHSVFGARLLGALVISSVSHQHLYGFLFKALWPLFSKTVFWLESVVDENHVLVIARHHGNAIWITSPLQIKRIASRTIQPGEADGISLAFLSGGPAPEDAKAFFIDNICGELVEVYGSTETGGIAYRTNVKGEILAQLWTAFPGTKLSTSTDGCLTVTSTLASNDGESVVTADVIEFVGDRFLLKLRNDRTVKVDGKRLSLVELESEINQIAGIKESRCIVCTGLRDEVYCLISVEDWYIESALYLEGVRQSVKSIRSKLLAHFAPSLVPKKIRFVQELPTNSQGKVLDNEVMNYFSSEGARKRPIEIANYFCAEECNKYLYVPKDLIYFEGHFEGHPIVPGVVQLHWVSEFASNAFGKKFEFQRLESVKFKELITPTSLIKIRFSFKNNKVNFSIESRQGTHASGRMLVANA